MRTVVVGAGITGLVLARRLQAQGVEVVVLEAKDHAGGQILTVDFAGRRVDVGAEAIHLGAPQARALVEELDLLGRIVPAAEGTSWMQTRRGLRELPAGVGPTGPTRIGPVVGSGILSLRGMARAALEPLMARRHRTMEDVSVGAFIRQRFGDEVASTFVDPLLGNLHSGDIDRLSLTSTAPQLVARAREGTSLLPWPLIGKPGTTPKASLRSAPRAPSMFSSFPHGLTELVEALVGDLDVRLQTPALAVSARSDGWTVTTPVGDEHADALVLACPAAAAGHLLEPLRPGLARQLTAGRTADVATVVLAYPRLPGRTAPLLDRANGLLLTSSSGRLTKAMTNLSRKWPHLHHPELHLVRASVGRAGEQRLAALSDEQLVDAVVADLHEVADLPEHVYSSLVVRWPAALPQLEVGHAARMRLARARLDGLPPVALAGSPFDGLGLGATIRSANDHASELLSALTSEHQEQS